MLAYSNDFEWSILPTLRGIELAIRVEYSKFQLVRVATTARVSNQIREACHWPISSYLMMRSDNMSWQILTKLLRTGSLALQQCLELE